MIMCTTPSYPRPATVATSHQISRRLCYGAWRKPPRRDSREPRNWKQASPPVLRPTIGMLGKPPFGGRSLSRGSRLPRSPDEAPLMPLSALVTSPTMCKRWSCRRWHYVDGLTRGQHLGTLGQHGAEVHGDLGAVSGEQQALDVLLAHPRHVEIALKG